MHPPRLIWTPGFIGCLKQIPWQEAARVCRAMIRLVSYREGRPVQVVGDPNGYQLHVPPYVVRYELDRERAIVRVLAVYRH